MEHLREDPSLASETLDHPGGWPENGEVCDWLLRAFAFLGEHAPEGRFAFRAGWGDNSRAGAVGLTLAELLRRVRAAELRADELYEVDASG